MSDVTVAGDAARQAEIARLPEDVEILFVSGERVHVPFRAAAQAADDDWRRFRDSGIGKLILNSMEEIQDD